MKPFQQPSMVNSLPMRSSECLGEFSSNYTLNLVTGRALALPTALIVAKFASVYLTPSNISVDLAMALYSLLPSLT